MSEVAAEDVPPPLVPPAGPEPMRRGSLRAAAGLAAAGLVALAGTWLLREPIADALIARQLRTLGLPAAYRIGSIGLSHHVVRDIVIGDPRRPDLTIERIEVELVPRFGLPAIGTVRLVRPRLYGTWQGDRVRFGQLDPLLRGPGSGAPFRLPRLTLVVIDGRARLAGDHGPIGLAFAGQGDLSDGFAGTLAAVAPRLAVGNCALDKGSLFGSVRVERGQPVLHGPLRMEALACPGLQGLRARRMAATLTLRGDPGLDGGAVRLVFRSGPVGGDQGRARSLGGAIDGSYRGSSLIARYDLLGRNLAEPRVAATTLALAGVLRTRGDFSRVEAEGTVEAGGLRPGEDLAAQLLALERGAQGTLIAPLVSQARQALLRETRDSRFAGSFLARSGPRGLTVVLPQGRWTGGSGATLLALSRVQLTSAEGPLRLAGNFVTGGAGLPRITGRLDQGAAGRTGLTLAMADYRAGDARLAVPRLILTQDRSGALGLTGTLAASGAVPGGQVRNLVVPLDALRDARGQWALWPRCTSVSFAALTLSDLALDTSRLTLCPPRGQPMVAGDGRGWRLAVGSPALDLSGRLGQTPVRIASGPVGYGLRADGQDGLSVSALDIALGPPANASHFRVSDLRAHPGADLTGTFTGADVRLAAVPLDLLGASGAWRFAGGRLTLVDATFRLEDRARDRRFEPLQAEGATLALADSRITAGALLREPGTRQEVARVGLVHDLTAVRGHADLRVPGLVFDKALQPDQITRLLLGVVANVAGRVEGEGRIDWAGDTVQSGGRFRTEGLDLAAAFGPAKGIKGEVVFTDLLGLVTPPHQRFTVASLNPGIEALDGEMLFQLKPGSVVAIEGAQWPFLGGRLTLRPVELRFGVAETRRFVIDIAGLEAAQFLERMDLANLAATGAFDGTLPLVFDQNGGRIDGGMLTSRLPGGNLSYVGALTYKDLSPVANFAFDALRSLDFRAMRIAMDGALEGDVVTRVRFDGITQGEGARRNFMTRQLARLPLQFNINLRAPFYSLIGSVKAMYDPAYVKDPRSLGLVDGKGRPVARPAGRGATGTIQRIQHPVSETKP